MAEKAERQRFIAQCIQALEEKKHQESNKAQGSGLGSDDDDGRSAKAAARCYQKLQFDFPDITESEAEILLQDMRASLEAKDARYPVTNTLVRNLCELSGGGGDGKEKPKGEERKRTSIEGLCAFVFVQLFYQMLNSSSNSNNIRFWDEMLSTYTTQEGDDDITAVVNEEEPVDQSLSSSLKVVGMESSTKNLRENIARVGDSDDDSEYEDMLQAPSTSTPQSVMSPSYTSANGGNFHRAAAAPTIHKLKSVAKSGSECLFTFKTWQDFHLAEQIAMIIIKLNSDLSGPGKNRSSDLNVRNVAREILHIYVALVASNVKRYPPSEKSLTKIVVILLETKRETTEDEPSSLGVIYSAFATIDRVLTSAIYSKSKGAIVGVVTEIISLFPLLAQAVAMLRAAQQGTRTQIWTDSMVLLTDIISKANLFAVESTNFVKQLMTSGLFRTLVDVWCNESHVSQCMENITLAILKLCTSSAELRNYVCRVPLVQTKIAVVDVGQEQLMSITKTHYQLLLGAAGCLKASSSEKLCQHIKEEDDYQHLAGLLSLMNDITAEKPYSKARYSFDENVLKSVEETRQKLLGKLVSQEDADDGENYLGHEKKEKKLQVILQRCLKECKVLLHDGAKKVE